jgi:nucleoporin GLE1
VYSALCYSLAKAILLQAETEVTAEKRSAIPLARVAFNLMTTLEVFPDMFWAKLVQRMGGWAIPCIIPDADVDGRAWSTGEKRPGRGGEKEKWRVMGYRMNQSSGNGEFEAQGEYSSRVSGIMRVYWEILKVQLMFPHQAPPDGPFVISRYWMWFSRLLEERPLLETAVGAELIYSKSFIVPCYLWG